jgi:hypothetical protein
MWRAAMRKEVEFERALLTNIEDNDIVEKCQFHILRICLVFTVTACHSAIGKRIQQILECYLYTVIKTRTVMTHACLL